MCWRCNERSIEKPYVMKINIPNSIASLDEFTYNRLVLKSENNIDFSKPFLVFISFDSNAIQSEMKIWKYWIYLWLYRKEDLYYDLDENIVEVNDSMKNEWWCELIKINNWEYVWWDECLWEPLIQWKNIDLDKIIGETLLKILDLLDFQK